MEKILLISNMYPSKKYKHYGVFVQNTASILKNNGYQVDVSALKKKDSNLGKLGGYLSFYIKSIFLCLFHRYDYLYAHYISHCACCYDPFQNVIYWMKQRLFPCRRKKCKCSWK